MYNFEQFDKDLELTRKTIGANTELARKKKCMHKSTLARLTNMSPSHISKIENGKGNCSLALMVKICKVLDISMSSLFDPTYQSDSFSDFEDQTIQNYYKFINDRTNQLHQERKMHEEVCKIISRHVENK